MLESFNRRKWDGKIGLSLKVSALVSTLWAGGVWLDSQLITISDYNKQRNYTDYQVIQLRLEISLRVIDNLEDKLKNGSLTAREQRRYNQLIKDIPEYEKRLHKLGGTF